MTNAATFTRSTTAAIEAAGTTRDACDPRLCFSLAQLREHGTAFLLAERF